MAKHVITECVKFKFSLINVKKISYFTSKKVLYTYDLLDANSTNAKKVEKPPLKTAPPISARAR